VDGDWPCAPSARARRPGFAGGLVSESIAGLLRVATGQWENDDISRKQKKKVMGS
jgi:hypothetical protein